MGKVLEDEHVPERFFCPARLEALRKVLPVSIFLMGLQWHAQIPAILQDIDLLGAHPRNAHPEEAALWRSAILERFLALAFQ